METKYHVKHYDEKENIVESQQSELRRFFEKNKLDRLKIELDQFTIEVLSEEPPKKDYRKFVKKLKFLINYGWELVFQYHRYQIRIDVEPTYFIENPLYLAEKFRSPQFRHRNSGLSGFYGDITNLSIVDAANIYTVLNDFYNEISIISWLELLDHWLYVTEEDGNLWDFVRTDQNPLKTQVFLAKLIESLYLFSMPDFFLAQAINMPTTHLLYNRTSYQDMDIDDLEQYNPYFWLVNLFDGKSIDYYISNLNKLHKPVLGDNTEALTNSEYYNLGKEFRVMIQTIWMTIQCRILPMEWTKVFEVDRSIDAIGELQNDIKSCLNNLPINSPVNLENLIGQLFGREWKVLAYEKAIDIMVEQKVCDKSRSITFSMCSMQDLELIIKTCYLMLLEMKRKKATGQLVDIDYL